MRRNAMRTLSGLLAGGLMLLLVLGFGAVLPAGADEPAPEAGKAKPATKDSLAILRARLEALVRKAALLEKAGDIRGALAAYAEVERVYRDTIRDLQALLVKPDPAGDDAPPRPPMAGPALPTPEALEPIEIGPKGPTGFDARGKDPVRTPKNITRGDRLTDALRWLQAHQSPSGAWDAADFVRWCDLRPVPKGKHKVDGAGLATNTVGTTGLALCAFLGAGYTNRGNHPFRNAVSRGLRYLKNVQDPEGAFGSRSNSGFMYGHAIASLAMVEAYGMTLSPIFKGSAQRALDFHAKSRNPYLAWRYGVRPGENDTSISTWMLTAVKSGMIINGTARANGRVPPLKIDDAMFVGMRAWLDKVTDPDYGRVGYISRGSSSARPKELLDKFPPEKSEAMTAAGIFARIMMGEDPRKSDVIQKGAQLLTAKPPVWNVQDGSIDMTYWYFGTLAAYQVGGQTWRVWQRKLDRAILDNQRQDSGYCGYKGSWDPVGPWGAEGGRVYSTALMALCLEIAYRYDRVFGVR